MMNQPMTGHSTPHDRPAAKVEAKTEIDNDRVRVVRFRFEPHARVPMHSAPDVVSIALTAGHLRLTYPDGTTQDFHYQAGQTGWLPAQSHAGENMENTPLEFVAVQLKK